MDMPVSLPLSGGRTLPDGLGGAGGGRDDVLEDAAAAAPVLLGRAVDGLLGGGGGVDGGHEAADDAELVIEDLGDGSEAVRGAAEALEMIVLTGIGLVVDAVRRTSGCSSLDGADMMTFLAPAWMWFIGGVLGIFEEEAGGLDDDVGAGLRST